MKYTSDTPPPRCNACGKIIVRREGWALWYWHQLKVCDPTTDEKEITCQAAQRRRTRGKREEKPVVVEVVTISLDARDEAQRLLNLKIDRELADRRAAMPLHVMLPYLTERRAAW